MRLIHSNTASSLVVSSSLVLSALANFHVARDSTDFNWASLASSTTLSWTPCYDAFQCARFTVPLQYSNLSAGEAQIALVMSPSEFKPGDENYLGPILFNPGGPGGSGVQYVLEFAEYFRAVIGPKYDLVGFDPRAVGQTTPPLSVFESPAEALEFYGDFPLNSNESVSSLGLFYTKSKILSNLVLDKAKVIAESVSTAAVATDMLGITRAFGFDKLSYWGISYGSVIGATYAAMFPENINHLLIDGVLNSHDWYAGNLFSSLQDTDKALASIYEACHEVGPTLCAIYENTTDLISARVNKIINDVHILPVPVYNNTDPSSITFGSVDYSVLISELFQMVYSPYALAPIAAEGLVQLEQGISGSITFQGTIIQAMVDPLATCDFNNSQPFVAGLLDTSNAIQCGDVLVNQTMSFPEVQKVYDQNVQTSLFAPQAYNIDIGLCTTWPTTITAKDRFNGSFTTNTSSPILLIGNTFDPITPITGARNMSAGFVGSVLLQQNSTGHTSLSGFSTCTALAIHAYFANGTLPAPGTVCQPDTTIFQNPANSSAQGAGVNITIPNTRRSELGVYTLREAVDVVARSNFLVKSSVLGRMMRRAF
ncbi:hypothetical protein PHLGIDRAFT_179591 [Phlebiopsis gigantea 11061_1 CR5-6]|uniref:Peptidase S33 tripeptidyl aminopeptidase-like C-terminal domain-containing protein n=1 Tax=Phlebiopsis gigantea (strain 11061_1 CR5-6) TaxID=745531 RepID=A0A0C3S7Q8_PHLG1|nr:hypothetical protein PHLGIDRAFT_179591 [Phlebiopsis gigantea 11061_1 CR5-6]